jgi:three-Cys-motif partner protein
VSTKRFFETASPQNIIKTKLVAKYFGGWATIMLRRLKYPGDRLAYIDLFAGPGKFEDGKASTPLWILNHAIAHPELCKRLTTVFNDKDSNHAEQLQVEVDALAGIERLTNPPQILNLAVGSQLVDLLRNRAPMPTLFFIDPWGYKGLSLDLIGTAIKSWGCDCIFFFNYNRINQALPISSVEPLMNDLFGVSRVNHLRQMVTGLSPDERQETIIGELIIALKEVGGEHALPFEFESQHGERPSHYIIFVSKSKRGYLMMKDIMFGLSSDDNEVKRFGYVPVRSPQLSLLLGDYDRPYSIPALRKLLMNVCAGRSLTVKQVYEDFTIDTPYVMKHVKDAIKQLEVEKLVEINIPAEFRRKPKGILSLADHLTVTFPP